MSAALSTETHIVRAVCPHDCPDTCAMLVTVQAGRVTRIVGDPTTRRPTARCAPRSTATPSAATTPTGC